MNCQEFSEHATEIARAAVMDAAARDAALGHADGCAACAARLERERALSSALRATAESFNDAAAPARVESALLAAFRAGRDAAAEPAAAQPFAPAFAHAAANEDARTPATRASVHTFAARFGRRARVAFAAAAVAASLILTFAVAMRAPQQRIEPTNEIAAHQASAAPTQPLTARPASAPGSGAQSSQAATVANVPETDAPAKASESDGVEGRLNKSTDGGRRSQRAAGLKSMKKSLAGASLAFNIDGGQAVFAEGDSPAAAAEVANLRGDAAALTDFVPLAAGANQAPLDGGQVVRVEAPRAALASLGLPVDARRADEKVKADLLLAHDGTPQAIRLVR